jgi:acyl-CoA thioesterase-2
VVAIQGGRPIYNLAASFQVPEEGFEHHDAMANAPPPESLPSEIERGAKWAALLPPFIRDRLLAERPFELRPAEEDEDPFKPTARPPRRAVWMKTIAPLPDDPALHGYLLAYASDHYFITTALLPHGVSIFTPGMQVASVDHTMWFHQPFRVDDWLLYAIDSPAAQGGRGLVRGQVFTRDGRLVASTAQEGLIRRRPPRP